jgi:glucuronate isomerase
MVGGGRRRFPIPAALLITPDHYLLRMLYSLGVPMEDLGVGKPVAARDSRAIFRIFAAALGRVSRHAHTDVDGAHALRGDRRRSGARARQL